jgi:hypothetical protein
MSQPGHQMPGTGNPTAAEQALRGLPRMPTTSHCFSYPTGPAPGSRPGIPATRGYPCFSYPTEMPPGDRPGLPEGRLCFSYSDGMPPSGRPRLPEGKLCFSY